MGTTSYEGGEGHPGEESTSRDPDQVRMRTIIARNGLDRGRH